MVIEKYFLEGLERGKKKAQKRLEHYFLKQYNKTGVSKPNEIARRKTGELGKSWRSRSGRDNISISLNTKYAGYLEEGTANMQARPNLKNTIEANKTKIEKDIKLSIYNMIYNKFEK